ncbi:hypothetical protein C8J57DRAFT_265998 [Mycena rebaudengoi]|nr:hypothetical protein C8J57DRAFT_265998 [Mycena rebaudengoi]
MSNVGPTPDTPTAQSVAEVRLPNAGSARTRNGRKRGELPCRAWKDGHCPKGTKCWYGHDPQVQQAERLRREQAARAAEREEARRAEQAAAQKAREVLQAAAQRAREELQAAEHERREAARLARLAEQEAAERARQIELEARRAETIQNDAAKTIQHIVLGSSLVTYSAGIAIQEAVVGFESCRIQVKNLPGDATQAEIAALFTQQGIDPSRLFVTGMRRCPDGRCEASLITTAEEGGAVAIGLEEIEFRHERLHFEVAESSVSGGMGNSARNSNTLTMSWRSPFTTAIVTFPTAEDAEAKVRLLNRKVCGGRQVHVEMNQPPPHLRRYDGWQCSIKILGLPTTVSPEEVGRFAGSAAYAVRFLRPVVYDLGRAIEMLKEQVERLARGALESFDVVTRDNAEGNNTAKAHFKSHEGAKLVHDWFAGQRLEYLGRSSLRLWLPDPLQYIISIPVQQYQAQKRTWDSLADSGAAHNKTAYIRTTEVPNKVQIRVLGDDKKAVGSLKVRVENLAGGERLDASYWHRAFMSGNGSRFLASLYERTNAYVRADWKLCIVTVYGDATSIDKARDAVKSEVERLNSLEYPVFIKRQSIRFFVRTGLEALKEALGDENASLEISPHSCKVVIRGGEEARHILTRLIDESLGEAPGAPVEHADACPICYDTISHPVTLGCQHTYCMPCLAHFLLTAAERPNLFPLKCLGDEATCGVPIPIPTIEKFLPTPQFHRLLEVAFVRHIEQHPQELKYCKTADCTQVYRSSAAGTATCPSCFLSICCACDEEAHEGMTCEERKLHHDPGEQERRNDAWARQNGVKRCPACSVWIERTEGCNHMSCRCGAHMCWVCGRQFEQDEIYPHLNAAHGGAFAAPPDDEPVVHVPAMYGVQEARWQGARQGQDRVAQALQEFERLAIAEEAQQFENRARLAAAREAERREAARRFRIHEYQLQAAALEVAQQQRRLAAERERQIAAERDRGWGCVVM